DAPALGAGGATRGGSSPSGRILTTVRRAWCVVRRSLREQPHDARRTTHDYISTHMPDILVKKTRAEPGEASLEVTIPPDNVKAAEERATKVYQQRARLPGFRQGKVPAAVVRKKFADDIRQETLRELVQESWRVAQ